MSTRVAIVTGAAQGIGRATVHRLVQEGVRIVASDVNEPNLQECRASCADPTLVRLITQDITNATAPADAVRMALDAFGGIDWLVNNAGIGNAKPVHETDDMEWDRYLDVNLRSAFRFARAVLPHLQAGRGAMVHVSSIFGILGNPRSAPYAASKAALLALMRQYALEGGAEGVRVNGLNADRIRSGLLTDSMIADRAAARGLSEAAYMGGNLLGQEVRAEDVADAFVALARLERSTGALVTVDGGNVAAMVR